MAASDAHHTSGDFIVVAHAVRRACQVRARKRCRGDGWSLKRMVDAALSLRAL